MLKNHEKKYALSNIDVTVTARESGAQFQLTAEKFTVMVTNVNDIRDTVFSTEVQARIECIQPDTFRVVVPGPKTEPVPKYNAAMGDAAQAYCDSIAVSHVDDSFRWEEVWKRMWAARGQSVPVSSDCSFKDIEKDPMRWMAYQPHEKTMGLDGSYTIEELMCIVDHMRSQTNVQK